MQKKLPKIINQEEFETLLKAIERRNIKRKKELRLAMLLGFEAGMRISEILGYEGWSQKRDKKTKELLPKVRVIIPKLSRKQIDDVSIKIIDGKGGKDRIVPRPKRINETALKLLPLKIKRRTLQRIITKLGMKILDKKITFHTLRHGFGSHLAQTRPLHEIQMLMGHSRLDTTGIYLHANPKEAIEKARNLF